MRQEHNLESLKRNKGPPHHRRRCQLTRQTIPALQAVKKTAVPEFSFSRFLNRCSGVETKRRRENNRVTHGKKGVEGVGKKFRFKGSKSQRRTQQKRGTTNGSAANKRP